MKLRIDAETEIETGEIQSSMAHFDAGYLEIVMDDNTVHKVYPDVGEDVLALKTRITDAIDRAD